VNSGEPGCVVLFFVSTVVFSVVVPVDAPSLVPDQPMGEEAYIGARNRLYFIKENHKDADFWISQEGGLFEDKGRLSNRAWIIISDKSGFTASL
jgi:non-canonical (house-cleaning) NTP pyrophosphatase